MKSEAEWIYCALFVSSRELDAAAARIRTGTLCRRIGRPHVTLAFRPAEFHAELLGTRASLLVRGYGSDGQNEGLLVTIETEDKTLRALAAAVERPHITLSVGPKGRPVDTARICFRPVTPFRLAARYGIFCADGRVLFSAQRAVPAVAVIR